MEKYSDCPYYKPNSYHTKEIECEFCGYISRFVESKIRAIYDKHITKSTSSLNLRTVKQYGGMDGVVNVNLW